jgi:hypothetical protein
MARSCASSIANNPAVPFGATHPPTIRTICRSNDQAFSFCTRGLRPLFAFRFVLDTWRGPSGRGNPSREDPSS